MNLFIYIMDVFQSSTFQDGTEKAAPTFDGVNGGGIMHRAERPDGPFAGVQKCPNHGPLSVATRGGGCTAWSSMRRFDWRLSTRV